MTKTAIYLSVELAKKVRKRCAEENISISKFFKRIEGLYGKVNEAVVKEYLWTSEKK